MYSREKRGIFGMSSAANAARGISARKQIRNTFRSWLQTVKMVGMGGKVLEEIAEVEYHFETGYDRFEIQRQEDGSPEQVSRSDFDFVSNGFGNRMRSHLAVSVAADTDNGEFSARDFDRGDGHLPD